MMNGYSDKLTPYQMTRQSDRNPMSLQSLECIAQQLCLHSRALFILKIVLWDIISLAKSHYEARYTPAILFQKNPLE